MLDKLHFIGWVDLPLALATVLVFILHFNAWARTRNTDTGVDLSARLATARVRVVCLFAVLVGLCWMADFAVWGVFAFLLAIGILLALLGATQTAGGEFLLGMIGYLIREWAFGFPHLVLQPPDPTRARAHRSNPGDGGPLIGRSGLVSSPLRPCGQIECDGSVWPARADDGGYVDAGAKIVVTGFQNGVFVVRGTNTAR